MHISGGLVEEKKLTKNMLTFDIEVVFLVLSTSQKCFKRKYSNKNYSSVKTLISTDKGEVGGSSPLRPILKKTPF